MKCDLMVVIDAGETLHVRVSQGSTLEDHVTLDLKRQADGRLVVSVNGTCEVRTLGTLETINCG